MGDGETAKKEDGVTKHIFWPRIYQSFGTRVNCLLDFNLVLFLNDEMKVLVGMF